MKLERRKFHYQGYYNSIQGCPVPCECVLEYVEPIEAEALEQENATLRKRNEELERLVDPFGNAPGGSTPEGKIALLQNHLWSSECLRKDDEEIFGKEIAIKDARIAELEKRVEELELAVERATANMIAAQNRAAELEQALREIKGMEVWSGFREGFCKMKYIAKKALEAKG